MIPVVIKATSEPRRIVIPVPRAKPFSALEMTGSPPFPKRMYTGSGQSKVALTTRVISGASAGATTVMFGNARMIAMSSSAMCVGPSGA